MNASTENTELLWPLLVYAAIVFSLVGVILGLSYILGQHHNDRATGDPYEGGILSTGSARLRFSSQFYMIAMLFVIFDVETVFIMSWAIAFKELGWYGYFGVLVFIVLLVVVLIYEWRNGALDFGPDGQKILKAYTKINRKAIVNAQLRPPAKVEEKESKPAVPEQQAENEISPIKD